MRVFVILLPVFLLILSACGAVAEDAPPTACAEDAGKIAYRECVDRRDGG